MRRSCERSCCCGILRWTSTNLLHSAPVCNGANGHNASSKTGELKMNFSRYRVKPGSHVRLKDWDPADKRGVPSDKQERVTLLTQLSEDINRLQDLLYAAHEKGVLIVLQGLDTAGKDGTIRHVFKAVDPLGVRAV